MTTVTLPYDPEYAPHFWAIKHCPSYITNDIHMAGYNHYDPLKTDYHFSNSKDAVLFILRWL
jgi:hypothetical protein